jgi:tRNA dimethylallyltransferase
MKPLLIVVCGPTASGKTGLAIELAKHFHTEIISADSRQFYKEMNIGVARPSVEELAAVPHHFVGFLSIHEQYSAGHFARDAEEWLENWFQENPVAIMAGGSGLYIRTILDGVDQFPEIPTEIKEQLNTTHADQGIEALQEELQRSDPEYYQIVDVQNPARLKRALEVIRVSGQTYSSFRTGKKKELPYRVIKIGINPGKELLDQRIRQRLKLMFEAGLEAEVQTLMPYKDLVAMQTVGYREFIPYFNQEITKEELEEQIFLHTRQYAKRQMTWFRKESDIHWFDSAIPEPVIQLIENELNS